MFSTNLAILLNVVASLGLSQIYFLHVEIKRAPIGVMNLWDVTFMMVSILIIPYLYLLLPFWTVSAILGLETAAFIYFVFEPIVRAKTALWLLALVPTLADIAAASEFGVHNRIFY